MAITRHIYILDKVNSILESNRFNIVKAAQKDAADIAQIHVTSWQVTYADLLPKDDVSQDNSLAQKQQMWPSIIDHPSVDVWLAKNAQGLSVGFISICITKTGYDITTLYVLPEYQGLGVGTLLMQTALAHIKQIDRQAPVYLWVLKTNMAAIGFYQTVGFICTDETVEETHGAAQIIDIKMVKKWQIST